MINDRVIKARSQELNIPYENMLCGCLLEEIVSCLASLHQDELWLINDFDLGLDQYKKKKTLKLIYSYKGRLSELEYQEIIEDIRSHLQKSGIQAEDEFSTDNKQAKIRLTCDFEKKYIPLEIMVRELDNQNAIPNTEELILSLENNKRITYYHYPMEDLVAESIYQIISKLELLNEMDHYIKLYDLTSQNAIDGRKVSNKLSDLCQDNLELTKERLAMLEGYKSYTYMKRKWKVLLRKHKRQNPSWEEVLEYDLSFIKPIYLCLMEDQVFFGDWMPQLGRFLD